jgi:hypothetical protein
MISGNGYVLVFGIGQLEHGDASDLPHGDLAES